MSLSVCRPEHCGKAAERLAAKVSCDPSSFYSEYYESFMTLYMEHQLWSPAFTEDSECIELELMHNR